MNFSHLLFAFGSYGTGSLVRADLGFWEGRIHYTANFVKLQKKGFQCTSDTAPPK
jgi:hypothetical protein